MNAAYLEERIARTKATIEIYEDAVDALASGRVQSYTIDTGQNRQTATRFEIGSLQRYVEQLYVRLATLEARLNGGNVLIRPGF